MKAIVRRAPVLLGFCAAALVAASGCALEAEGPGDDAIASSHDELTIADDGPAADADEADEADEAEPQADTGAPDGSDATAGLGDAEDPDPYPWRDEESGTDPSDPCPGDAVTVTASLDRDHAK